MLAAYFQLFFGRSHVLTFVIFNLFSVHVRLFSEKYQNHFLILDHILD